MVLWATAPVTAAVVASAAAVVVTFERSVTFAVVLTTGGSEAFVLCEVERSTATGVTAAGATSLNRPVVAGTKSDSDSKAIDLSRLVRDSCERVSTATGLLASLLTDLSAVVAAGKVSSY